MYLGIQIEFVEFLGAYWTTGMPCFRLNKLLVEANHHTATNYFKAYNELTSGRYKHMKTPNMNSTNRVSYYSGEWSN